MRFSNILMVLPYIDDIVKVIADAKDGDSTKDKAADVLEDLFELAIKYFSITDPAVALEISTVYSVLKPELDKLKDKPVVSLPVQTPA